MTGRPLPILVCLVFSVLTSQLLLGQRVTTSERESLKEIRTQVETASRLLRQKKIDESLEGYRLACNHLEAFAAGARSELTKVIKPEYERLQKLNKQLKDAGHDVSELAPLDELVRRETSAVSFKDQVAPIMVAKCGNCHVDRARGRFSSASYDALEKSTTIAFGIPKDSRIVQVIESGEMPQGGLTVSAEELQVLKDWIEQGAKFDGDDRNQNLRELAGGSRQPTPMETEAPTLSRTHEELQADRLANARKNWNIVIGSSEPSQLTTQNIRWFSDMGESRLSELSSRVESLIPKIANTLKANSKEPLVKGNLTVYVFEKRYDLSEFGKMIDRRDIPKEAPGHWNFSVSDASAAVLMTQNQIPEDAEATLVQQIAALHTASLASDVPRWFADGTGYWTAARLLPKHAAMEGWEKASASLLRSLTNTEDLLSGRVTEYDAGLIGFQVVKMLKKQSANFDRALANMRSGQTFEEAFQNAYGATPQGMLSRGW